MFGFMIYVIMDRSWINARRTSEEYENEVE